MRLFKATEQQSQPVAPPAFLSPEASLGGDDLSEIARSIWAKSDKQTEQKWLPLYQHLMDAADTAGRLFDDYLSDPHRELLAQIWEGDQDRARATLVFLAGAHDVGKASLEFVCQHSPLADLVREEGLAVPPSADVPHRSRLPHGFVSQFALEDLLVSRGCVANRAHGIATLVGVHHGRYPRASQVKEALEDYLYGPGSKDPKWAACRAELIEWMARRAGFPLDGWGAAMPAIGIAPAGAYASAVVVADWLASNEGYFPLIPIRADQRPLGAEQQKQRAAEGWHEARLPRPLQIPPLEGDITRAYREQFGWGEDRTPNPTQTRAAQLVRDSDVDLLIVEAPTGSGKTELALTVAGEMIRRRHLQGAIIALPTQATTDAMFERVTPWAQWIAAKVPQHVGVHLAHGRNDLNQGFQDLYPSAKNRVQTFDAEDDKPGLFASSWMAKRWRSTLSPLVVGTIDQVLLAALKSRHVLLRHLGLMGKAVVIDEVHAADTYMETYLEAALTWLGMYHVPVVLLSATLPGERRTALVKAYRRGRAGREDELPTDVGRGIGYPVLTSYSVAGDSLEVHPTAASQMDRDLRRSIRPLVIHDESDIAAFLDDELAEGGCAVVIRNTVMAAQSTYAALVAHFGRDDMTLTHARFLAADRVTKDRDMLDLFGRNSTHRPHRHIVVATQVIEQSLDVDFDLMLTDPAPMDLVLQRIGRLHRHPGRVRPSALVDPRAHVLVTDVGEEPWGYLRGCDTVYGRHRILRFLGILADQGGELRIEAPGQVAELTELACSADSVGPAAWQAPMEEAREADARARARSVDRARTWCLDGLNLTRWTADDLESHFAGDANDGESGIERARGVVARAAVRDGDEQIPVTVIPVDPFQGNVPVWPTWIKSEDRVSVRLEVGEDIPSQVLHEVRTWTTTLAPWQLRNKGEGNDQTIEAVAKEIWDNPVLRGWVWTDNPMLKDELILPMTMTDEFSTTLHTTVHGHELVYSPERGLEVKDL
ncbi:CRISPR-associated helicase Cas3' [Schaalia naturae]|uniref:CRISPR-associated helicase Cas3 n=1 Tax=Schaalia naturae TaxID=635203 RepID=A0ABW2SQ64_9ACTO